MLFFVKSFNVFFYSSCYFYSSSICYRLSCISSNFSSISGLENSEADVPNFSTNSNALVLLIDKLQF